MVFALFFKNVFKGDTMKLAKLSMVTVVVAGLATSSYAADTLADAFKNGHVSGELRAYYYDREGAVNSTTSAVNSDIFTTGLILRYVSDSFYGFKLGATFQSSYSPFADGSLSNAGTAKSDFKGDMYGSGAVLSEAYIQYKIGNTTAKIGRQFINTPLVGGSPSRLITQSFEGAIVTNTDLPQTTLLAGVITKYQNRTDGAGNIGEFVNLESSAAYGDYGYTLLAINKSITNTTLSAQWAGLYGNPTTGVDADFYYLEGAYNILLGDFKYGLALNYEYKATNEIGQDDGTMYGAKGSFGYKDFNTYVAYTTITDDGDIEGTALTGGLGGGAQTAFAKGYQNKAGTYTRDTKSYSIDANYNFKAVGLLVGARYTGVDDKANDKESGYTDMYTVYNFTGALKGLATDISYQDWEKDADGHDLWFKANYKF